MSREFRIAADDDGIRLDRWFKRHMPEASFNLVSRWARTGQIRLDGARAEPGDRIAAGQTLRLPPAEAVAILASDRPVRERKPLSDDEIEFAQSLVIHRSPHALVLNKPPGLATQGGTKTTAHVDGLLDALQFEAAGRPKLVHRLDKDTSGVLLLARSAKAAAFFAKQFAARETRKIYWALVVGVPDLKDALIDLAIGKQPGTGGEKMHVDEAGQTARSRFRRIDRAGDRAAFMEMQPFTGRTHQLRVHAAATGHPIVGDGKYGGKDAFLTGGVSRKLHLHARRLLIELPDGGGALDVRAEPPEHFADSLTMLGFSARDGDLPLSVEKFSDTREGKKLLQGRDAKARRKERKGERRERGGRGEGRGR